MEQLAVAGAAAPTTELTMMELAVDGQSYLAGYRRIGGEHTPAWVVCLLLPRSEVMAAWTAITSPRSASVSPACS